MTSLFVHSKLLWQPVDPDHARVEAFRRFVNRKHGFNFKDYHELYDYSVSDFTIWKDLWEYTGIIYSQPPTEVVVEGRWKEIPRFFPGARLNYAENILRFNGDNIACTGVRESGGIKHCSFRELRTLVKDMAAAMRANGVCVGDRVAAIVTNHINAVVICLAAASIGAMYSSTAPDMGTQGVLDRYTQIKPKVLFAETEVVYAEKTINLVPKVSEVATVLSSSYELQKVVLLPSSKTGGAGDTSPVPCSATLTAFLQTGDGRPLVFEQLPFDQPLYILYTSGTSGPPKCIVHSAGGVLIQNLRDTLFMREDSFNDTYFQYTSTGWVMWTAQIHALAVGTRIILYDGSPFHPSPEAFLKLIANQGVTCLGTSARFLAEIRGRGVNPLKLASFEGLRTMLLIGTVLTPQMHEWAQEAFGKRVQILTATGGTDTACPFVVGVPSLPVYAGELQVRALGLKIEIFDPEGNNIEDTGVPGELVCTRPHPSLPLTFWGDESGERLRKTYFSQYPGIWVQGDVMVKNPVTKGFMVLGRSDGVLNPSGVRIGTAEIYSVLERFSDIIEESICVGQRRPEDKDERILLFLKMRAGLVLSADTIAKIKAAIREARSARHVPSYTFQVEDIPYTVNGKKIEIAVKQIVSGVTTKPSGSVANPESLQLYYKYRNLEKVLEENNRMKSKL